MQTVCKWASCALIPDSLSRPFLLLHDTLTHQFGRNQPPLPASRIHLHAGLFSAVGSPWGRQVVELQTGNRVQLLRKEAERVRGYTPEGERDANRSNIYRTSEGQLHIKDMFKDWTSCLQLFTDVIPQSLTHNIYRYEQKQQDELQTRSSQVSVTRLSAQSLKPELIKHFQIYSSNIHDQNVSLIMFSSNQSQLILLYLDILLKLISIINSLFLAKEHKMIYLLIQ